MSSAGREFDEWARTRYLAAHDQLSAGMREARDRFESAPMTREEWLDAFGAPEAVEVKWAGWVWWDADGVEHREPVLRRVPWWKRAARSCARSVRVLVHALLSGGSRRWR